MIEVLEDRQQDEADDNTPADAPAIDEGAVMLYFDASWCGPCQQMRPIVSRLEDDGFAVQTIDVDQQRDVPRSYNVKSIPAFVFLYDGEEIDRLIGATPENELRRRLSRAMSPQERSAIAERGHVWTELGIQIEEVSFDDPRLTDSHYRGAVRITQVREGSPAEDAALRADDLLVGLHMWETTSAENVEYVLNHDAWSTFAPLKFYVLRNGETLFGHFPQGSSIGLEFSIPAGHPGIGGIVPMSATPVPTAEDGTVQDVDLAPLPAGRAEPQL